MEKKYTDSSIPRNWILVPILIAIAIGLVGFGFGPQSAFAQQTTATPTAGQATQTPQAGQTTATPQAGQQATATPQAGQGSQLPQTGQQQSQAVTAETLFLGNVGVFSPGGFNQATFSIEKVDKRSVGSQPVDFVMPLVRIKSTSGNFPNVLTYVFFNVRPGSIEKKENRTQGVGVWFRSNNGGNWQRCANTMTIDDRTAAQMGMDIPVQRDGFTRIACLATQYNAIYGLGTSRRSVRTATSQ